MSRLQDIEAVRRVIEQYVEGSGGKVEVLEAIFHPQALMSGYFQGQLMIGSPEPFFTAVRDNVSPETSASYRAEIQSIDVVGRVATATLVETGFLGSDFVDFFQLVKVDGGWKIISKTFHQGQ